jgi:hypothetical protein
MEITYQLHIPAALVPGSEPPVHIGWAAEWATKQVWTLWRREEPFVPRVWSPDSVAWVRERTIPTSDCSLSATLVPTFAVRGCHVVSVTDPYSRILGFLDWSRYFFFQAAPQLYSRDWVDPVPDPLLLRKCGSAGNRTWTTGSVARNSDH